MPLEISAVRIARTLRETEAKMDDALLSAAKLMQELIAARQHPDVEVHTGQKAVIRLVAAQQSIVAGTSNLFRVHDEMLEVNRVMGIMDEKGITDPSGLLDSDQDALAA